MSERTEGPPGAVPTAHTPAAQTSSGQTSTARGAGPSGVDVPPVDEHARVEAAAAAAAAEAGPSWLRGRLTALRSLGLLGVLVILAIVGVATTEGRFLTTSNIVNILVSASIIGVVTVGMTFVIIGGGIDLSVGALVALASVWASTLQTQSYGPFVMVITALLVGMGAGLVNGGLIAYGRLVPFIVTLAMLVSARGLAQAMSDRRTQLVTVSEINAIATTEVLGIPLLVYLFAGVVVIGWVALNRTTFGRRTFAIGGNAEAARLAGIDVRRHTALLYVLSGLCCGIAAVMIMARTTTGSSTHGDLYELDAIAAVIIGGTLLTGGRGTLVGSILGVLVFTTITNLFVLNNLPTEVQNIAKGLIIIAAVLLQRRSRAAGP
jgi:ribose transport system permease protein